MKNNSLTRTAISTIICLLLAANSLMAAQEQSGADYSDSDQSSFAGEAAKAVVGRVFGVNGEAGNIDYHVVELTKVSPVNSAVRSALLPGWGQHFNRQRVKGTLLFLTFATATFGAFHLRNKSQQSFDRYERLGSKDSPLYDDYGDQQIQSVLLGGAALLLWGVSVMDAYRNAYNPLYSKNIKMDLAYDDVDDRTEVRFSKKF